jgi:allantoicase
MVAERALGANPTYVGMADLASRQLGGSVMFATDELFAEKENLIKPGPAGHAAGEFGNKGKVYDGWETRRRREPGHDHAIVRLGAPGIVHGVVVDTAWFRGNYPARISVEAVRAEGYPGPDELAAMGWQALVRSTAARGDTANYYQVSDRRRWTHVRLSIYPDGGVARFRVHGQVVPDPRFLAGTVDLAAMENGGEVAGCSDAFYASAWQLLLPGLARSTGEGWENARRRGPGNDYVVVRLGAAGVPRSVEVDTSCFVGNAPGWVRLTAGAGPDPDGSWTEIVPKVAVRPDTRHRFLVEEASPVSHVRLDVYPDGGLARLRVNGELDDPALAQAWRRWQETAG